MTRNEITEKITEIIKSNIDGAETLSIEPDTMLITSGYIDSFDIITLISVFEEAFNVHISFDDLNLEDFDTVSSIADIIVNKK